MREIKFRAWIPEIKEMVDVWKIDFNIDMIVWGDDHEETHVNYFAGHKKDCEIMQVTGLHDKNGKEIYEGDLISLINPYDDVETNDYARVVFSHGYVGGWVATVNDKDFLNLGTREKFIVVIGNTHKNPELITA